MGAQVQCGHCSNTITVPANRIEPGTVVGDFVIQQEIGVGGMGIVYLSHQLSLDRPAALKLLSGNYAGNTGFVEGFIKEARSAAKLNHPNIVQAYAVGEDDGIFYFAMEYIDGETMKEVLARENIIAPDRAIAIIEQITGALDYAWKEEHLIHRDIKPDNIMLTSSGRAKLADLGLAKMAEDAESDGETIMGTPQYISPEHLTGEPMDIRSDIYSLGATFYQFVTGEFPYTGASAAEIAQQHLTGELVPPAVKNPSLPAGLSDVICKMMAPHAENRYKSAEDLLEDLRAVKNNQPLLHAVPVQAKRASILPQVAQAIPVQAVPFQNVQQSAGVPEVPQVPVAPAVPQAPAAPQAPQGLQIPGATPKAPASPATVPVLVQAQQAPANPQAQAIPVQTPAAPKGLQIPGATPKAPAAPAPAPVPVPVQAQQVPAGLKAPGGLSIKKEEKKPEAPKQEEKKPEAEKKEEKKSGNDDKGKEKKEKKDLANPLMLERQEKARKQKQKKLFISLGIVGGIAVLAVAAVFVIGVDKVKNGAFSLYNMAAKKANLSTLEVSESNESALLKELEKLLAELENSELSQEEIWNKCEEFMAKKPDPATPEEEELYKKIRGYFTAADIEKCNSPQNTLHAEYQSKNASIREEEEARKQAAVREKLKADEARERERKRSEILAIENRLKAAAKRIEAKIQAARHKEMVALRKEFYSANFDFTTSVQEKQKAVAKIFAEAKKLLQAPSADPEYQEAKKRLGNVKVLRPDTMKLSQDMNTVYNAQRRALVIGTYLTKGHPKFKGISMTINRVICKVDKVENYTIYGKSGTKIYTITLEEMRDKSPAAFRRFIQEAFGRYGLNNEAIVPVFFAMNGDIKSASMLGEDPNTYPYVRKTLADYYKPYFDFVLKENRRDAALKAKLVKDLGKTLSYKYYLTPPKAPRKVAPPKRPAPPKKAPPKKAPAKKK